MGFFREFGDLPAWVLSATNREGLGSEAPATNRSVNATHSRRGFRPFAPVFAIPPDSAKEHLADRSACRLSQRRLHGDGKREMRTTLTERFVKSATAGDRSSPIFIDDQVIGFGLQVRQNGRKTFTLDYTFEARRRRYYIGDYPTWAVAVARDEAKRLKREVDSGCDPLATRDDRWVAPTIKDLVVRYTEEHISKLSKDHGRDQRNMLAKYVLPVWVTRRSRISASATWTRSCRTSPRGRARAHKTKTKQKRSKALKPAKPTPIQANRVGGIIRKMFNLAIRWELRPDNPAAAFIRNPEAPRERFLDLKEIARFSEILDSHPNRRGVNIVRMLMLTGARRGEVLNARWEQFDLAGAVWTKPAATTKQRRMHRVPISKATVDLLKAIHSTVPADCPWVFPGDADG